LSSSYVAVSGGFDPIHVGHLRYLRAAKELATGDGLGLMVILDSQEYLVNYHPTSRAAS
jgi:cytidyltransferase-like protein